MIAVVMWSRPGRRSSSPQSGGGQESIAADVVLATAIDLGLRSLDLPTNVETAGMILQIRQPLLNPAASVDAPITFSVNSLPLWRRTTEQQR